MSYKRRINKGPIRSLADYTLRWNASVEGKYVNSASFSRFFPIPRQIRHFCLERFRVPFYKSVTPLLLRNAQRCFLYNRARIFVLYKIACFFKSVFTMCEYLSFFFLRNYFKIIWRTRELYDMYLK